MAGQSGILLPVLELLPDGSCRPVLVNPKVTGEKQAIIAAARAGEDLEEDQARHVRVIGYQVPGREGDGKDELIALITTIIGMPHSGRRTGQSATHPKRST